MLNQHTYTDKEKKFLNNYIPGHLSNETQAAFIKKFGWEISVNQIHGYMNTYHIRSGVHYGFQNGNIPYNKGMKGVYHKGCEKTWFEKGHKPANSLPIGTEYVDKDGYILIKIDNSRTWKLKHRYVWEQTYGEIPKGYCIIFKDNDRSNCDIHNLMMVKRSQIMTMNYDGLNKFTGDFKETAALIADVKNETSKLKQRRSTKCRKRT